MIVIILVPCSSRLVVSVLRESWLNAARSGADLLRALKRGFATRQHGTPFLRGDPPRRAVPYPFRLSGADRVEVRGGLALPWGVFSDPAPALYSGKGYQLAFLLGRAINLSLI